MAVTRSRPDKQVLKSTTPRSILYTDLTNELVYFAPPSGADYVLQWDDASTDFAWLNTSSLINIYNNDGTITGPRDVSFSDTLSFLYDDSVVQTSLLIEDSITFNSVDSTIGSSVAFVSPNLISLAHNNIGSDVGSGLEISSNLAKIYAQHNTTSDNVLIQVTDQTGLISSTYSFFGGIKYGADYSTFFTNRSLVDKEYVDTAVTGAVTDLTFTGSSAPITLNSSSGTDVTFDEGAGIVLSQAGNVLTIESSITQYTDELAQDAVNSMLLDTDTITWNYVDATPSLEADVVTQLSITSDTSGIKLVNDSLTPGADQYYGTDSGGVKGYFALPSGDNIYNIDGTLTGNRTLNGEDKSLQFLFDDTTGIDSSIFFDAAQSNFTFNDAGAGYSAFTTTSSTGLFLEWDNISTGDFTTLDVGQSGFNLTVFESSGDQNININGSGMVITDSRLSQGLKYGADYSAYFATNPRSIPDIDYVESLIAGIGSGTTNYVTKWTSSTTLGNSLIYDNGTNVGIGTTGATSKFQVSASTQDFVNLTTSSGTGRVLVNAVSNSGISLRVGGIERWVIGSYLPTGTNYDVVFYNSQTATPTFFLDGDTNFMGVNESSPTQRLHVHGNLRVTGGYYDTSNTIGTSGYLLSSTGSGTSWISPASVISSGGGTTGSGTTNYIPKWSSSTALGNSLLYDNGTDLGLGVTSPLSRLHIVGTGATSSTSSLRIHNSTGSNFSLFVRDDGNIGIGTSAPTSYLHIKAGTATANTAPLKFTSGTNLTTPEAGAMEWDGSRLYITQTSGPTRQTLAYLTDVTALADLVQPANQVVLGTGSSITSFSNFTFNGSTLTTTTSATSIASFARTSGTGAGELSLINSVANTANHASLNLNVGTGGGDPRILFSTNYLTGGNTFALGIDNSDSDIFKLQGGAGAGSGLTGTTGIQMNTSSEVGINAAPVSGVKLLVSGVTRFTLGSDATGDIWYRNSSGNFTRLGIGSAGQVLTVASGLPSWAVGASGTVTSVAMTVPSILSVAGSPITTSGTLAVTLANQSANTIFAGPTTGAAAAPTFRSLVAADITAGGGTTGTGTAGQIAFFSTSTNVTSEAGSSLDALTWDSTNNRFGVRVASPSYTFHLDNSTDTTAYAVMTGALSTSADVVSLQLNRTAGSGAVSFVQSNTGTGDNQFLIENNAIGDSYIRHRILGPGISYTYGVDSSDSHTWKFGSGLSPSSLGSLFFTAQSGFNKIGLRTNPDTTQDIYLLGTLKLDLGSDATGDMYYRNSSGHFVRLGVGTDGYVLTLASGLPTWAAPTGGGTYTAGTGIDITSFVVTNTAPDQTVVLTPGTGISITGTYPNFTIASSVTPVTGIAAFVTSGNSNGLSISSSNIALHAATISTPGGISIGQQTITSDTGTKRITADNGVQLDVDDTNGTKSAGIRFTEIDGTRVLAQMTASSPDATNALFQFKVEQGGSLATYFEAGGLDDKDGVYLAGGQYADVKESSSTSYSVGYGDRILYFNGSTTTVTLQEIGTGAGQTKGGRIIQIYNDTGANLTVNTTGGQDINSSSTLLVPHEGSVTLCALGVSLKWITL